jgi:hypothetical protein
MRNHGCSQGTSYAASRHSEVGPRVLILGLSNCARSTLPPDHQHDGSIDSVIFKRGFDWFAESLHASSRKNMEGSS